MTETVISGLDLSAASRDDLAEIERLLIAGNLPVDDIKDLVSSFVVARNDGRVVGVAAIEQCGSDGLLRSVAVDPSMRGRGVGRALVQRLIADSEAKALRALYLLTTTAENYFPAFGFTGTDRDAAPETIQKTSQYRDLCPSSATLMRRPLGRK